MHELSVAMRIVEALDQELAGDVHDLPEEDWAVSSVALQIGALSGLVPEALEFSWDIATQDSLLKGSRLEIQMVDATGFCEHCREERTLTNLQSMRCPVCQTPITQITGGNELEILTVELEVD